MPGATAEPPASPPPSTPPAAPAAPPDSRVPAPSVPARPGSAKERMLKETGTRWEGEPPKAPDSPKPSDAPKPPDKPAVAEGDEPAVSVEAPPEIPASDKKKNPWHLLRDSKKRVDALERELSEAKTSGLAETDRAQYLERIEKAEAKIKDYENELRFKSYEKSQEFQEKYEQPYNQAWQKHMDDLRGVTITGDDGVARPMEAKDILDLVNLELADARDLADAKWGKFAGDAMTARKEIRDLFHARSKALEEARKTGAEREKQMTERQQKMQRDMSTHVKTTWDSANQAALADPNNGEYFKPVEGDDARNQLLGKGFALVDKAFAENPMDPRHTPEQRAEIVKRHAAVRNRAAAFGPMKYIIRKLREQVAELEKANKEFKGSQPPAAGGTAPGSEAPLSSGKAKLEAARAKWG